MFSNKTYWLLNIINGLSAKKTNKLQSISCGLKFKFSGALTLIQRLQSGIPSQDSLKHSS